MLNILNYIKTPASPVGKFSLSRTLRIKPVFYIILLFFTLYNSVLGQENLVPNGDFELKNSCPTGPGDFTCSDWFSPIITTPDYFSVCGTPDFSVPTNGWGTQAARSGTAYVGFNLNADDGYREYIAVKLIKPLIKNKTYTLKLFVSASDWTQYGSNNFSAYFLSDTSEIITEIMLSGTPAVMSQNNTVVNGSIIEDMLNWTELTFKYLSSGCEEFIILGNFKPQEETEFGINNGPAADCYYYVEDVSLINDQDSFELPNIFTPNGDGINDYLKIENVPIISLQVFNRWGELVFSGGINSKWDGSNCTEGVYFYTIELGCIETLETKTGFIQLIR